MSTLLKAALRYAGQGFHVFPCVANTKTPATFNGHKDATTDEQTIQEWWARDPDYNIAIYLEPSEIAVVDLDGWEGIEEWGELTTQASAWDTYTVRTPRGGMHLYFQGVLPPTQHKLAPHIDTRGTGSYVLVPPSRTDAGSYVADGSLGDMPLARLPAWVLERLDGLKKTAPRTAEVSFQLDAPQNVARAIAYLKNLGPVVEGEGSDLKTLATAMVMRDLGLSEDTAIQTMLDHYDCQPLEQTWLEEKVANAYKYAENAPGVDAVPGKVSETFAVQAAALVAALPPARRPRFLPYSEAEMDTLPAPAWLFKDLIPQEATCILYSPSGHYKTFIALDIALSAASGAPSSMGSPETTGCVFYVALEGQRGLMTTRRLAWKAARGVASLPDFYVMNGPLMTEDEEVWKEFLAAIRETAGDRPVRMVVIDTGAKMMAGTNENDARDAGRFVARCDKLRDDLHSSILAVMHSGKDTERGIRGSYAIHAGFDTIITLDTQRERMVSRILIEKQKDAAEREIPFHLQFRKIGGSLVPHSLKLSEYIEIVDGDNPFSDLNISRTLKSLKAGVADNPALSSHAFALLLLPIRPGQDPLVHQKLVDGVAKKLNKLGQDTLASHCDTTPAGLMWRAS